MNESTARSDENTITQGSEPSSKRPRGTFFAVDIEKEVSYFKNELFNLTNNSVVLADTEFAEINRLVEQRNDSQSEESCYQKGLLAFLPRLKSLLELCFILKRIQPYCEFVDDAILPYMRITLEKIRLACGCDLAHPSTWQMAYTHTAKINDEARRLDDSKLKLRGLYDDLIGDMEWFVMSFKDASWENKREFFVAINNDEQLLAWVQPWIDIAEGNEGNWRKALFASIDSLSAKEFLVQKRIYE